MSLRKRHTDGKVYKVFPMELQRIQIGRNVVYDRDTRGESWFILDLRGTKPRFIPQGAESLITADGKTFCIKQD